MATYEVKLHVAWHYKATVEAKNREEGLARGLLACKNGLFVAQDEEWTCEELPSPPLEACADTGICLDDTGIPAKEAADAGQ